MLTEIANVVVYCYGLFSQMLYENFQISVHYMLLSGVLNDGTFTFEYMLFASEQRLTEKRGTESLLGILR